jgi:WD40 repeat protein
MTGDKASVLLPDESRAMWKLERSFGSGDGKSAITDRVNALAFSPDGKTLAIGSGEPSRSGDITLWDIASGKMTANYSERHLDSVLTLDFSPDGKHLASGGADKAVRITELSSGKMVKLFEGHTHHVLGVSWRGDGRIIASSGADNVVKVWDWTTGDRRKNVEGWDKEVTSLHYLGSGDVAATTAGDAKVRLINSDGGEVKKLDGAKDFMNTLGSTHTGNLVVAGGEDGVLHIWDVATAKILRSFAPEVK